MAHPRAVLKVEVKYPVLAGLRVLNEREVIDASGAPVSRNVRARAQAGRGPDGPLPANHQGHRAWNLTGRTAASIGYVMRQDGTGRWRATVRPIGNLSDRDVGEIRRKIRERNKALRAAAALGPPIQSRGKIKKIKIRSKRPVDTSAAVAAVLSVRDKRPSSKRAIYRVVLASQADEIEASRTTQGLIRAELVEEKIK